MKKITCFIACVIFISMLITIELTPARATNRNDTTVSDTIAEGAKNENITEVITESMTEVTTESITESMPLISNKIDITEYSINMKHYNALNENQRQFITDFYQAATNGVSVIYHDLTEDEFNKALTLIEMYYGSTYSNIVLYRQGYAEIRIENFKKAVANKAEIDKIINEALANMEEGSVEFKLHQICDYIAQQVTYSYDIDYSKSQVLQALEGKGICGNYALLFYNMASRLGIKTYVCYGYVNSGTMVGLHAWNMIEIDGKQYFYDVTWYDGYTLNDKYIYSETSWGRNFVLNDVYGHFKK